MMGALYRVLVSEESCGVPIIQAWLAHLRNTGVKRCLFVDGYEDIIAWLKILDRPLDPNLRNIDTYDFTTMYTTLDQRDTGDKIELAIHDVFGDPGALGAPEHDYMIYPGAGKPCTWHNHNDPPEEEEADAGAQRAVRGAGGA
jgi:hypothetical protein